MHLIEADWPAPSQVVAFSTTREGGHSSGVYAGLNLGHHVADDAHSVAANRALLAAQFPEDTKIQWLSQVHGCRVVPSGAEDAYPEADASWTIAHNQACAILSADCLPVLFCDRAGTVVAAAHAGWRGLLEGVLEATIQAMPVPPSELMAWMGPAIGPGQFEVGPEVRDEFLLAANNSTRPAVDACFSPRRGRFYADLYQLARERLSSAGVTQIFGGGLCTYSDSSRFYSYRRDGQTGRMASLIYFKPGVRSRFYTP